MCFIFGKFVLADADRASAALDANPKVHRTKQEVGCFSPSCDTERETQNVGIVVRGSELN